MSAQEPDRSAAWHKRATRWSQLTWVENDPGNYSPSFWLDVFKRTRSNAVCLSAGGYIAYYPSNIQHHYVSKHIGDGDPFGELVDGARALGMQVMARVDPHAIHEDAAKAYPEWVMVSRDGEPMRHWAYPDVWVTCAYSSYSFEFVPQVVAELTRDYDIDAIFANRWQGHGICYCASCQSSFKQASGMALPQSIDAENPASQAWTAWRRRVLTRLVAQWDDLMKSIKPHTSFIPNLGAFSLGEFEPEIIEKHCPFLCVDDQARRGTEPVWMAGRNGKRMRGMFPDLATVLIASIGSEEEHRWKDSVTTGPELQAWLDNGTVQGLLPWFTKFNGMVPDARWVNPLIDSFGLHADLEPALAATKPHADIAMLDPTTMLSLHGYLEHRKAEAHDLGFYQALVEARLPFEILSDQRITVERLNGYEVIILANVTCLSDRQVAILEEYVAGGGSLVVGYETATRDELNRIRPEMALGELLGVRQKHRSTGPLKNLYISLSGEHPINSGFEGAERIIGGTHLLPVTAAANTEAPFLHIPQFPDLPMEEVYARQAPADPAVICRTHGSGGRTVYIPWNIGAIFWEVLQQDHARLITNCVQWALGDAPQVRVTGPGVLDISVRQGENHSVVALHNLTNPMMMKGPIRETYPIGAQIVSVPNRDGRKIVSVRVLPGKSTAEFIEKDGNVEIKVPEFERVAAVQIEWQ